MESTPSETLRELYQRDFDWNVGAAGLLFASHLKGSRIDLKLFVAVIDAFFDFFASASSHLWSLRQ
jgi:hypothetical protein